MKKVLISIILMTVLLLLTSCNNYVFGKFNFYDYFDTNLTIFLEYDSTTYSYQSIDKNIRPKVNNLLMRLEQEFRGNKSEFSDSTTQNINRLAGGSPTSVTDEYLYVLNKSKYYYDLCHMFDITIGPLTTLWHEYETQDDKEIDPVEISSAIDLVSMGDLIIEGNSVFLSKKDMALDFGGIAKGYAVDKLKELLEEEFTFFIINFGGNIYISDTTNLHNQEGIDEAILLEDPFNLGSVLMSIKASNKHIVTSGIANRYIMKDGIKYSHIIDPFTGYPSKTDIVQITLIADSSIDGDALSTIGYLMGQKAAIEFLSNLGYSGIIVNDKNQVTTFGNPSYQYLK